MKRQDKCEHGKQKAYCILCGGSQVCEHSKHLAYCLRCKGSQTCEHGSNRRQCRICGGFKVSAHTMYSAAKTRAKRDNLPFSITKSHIFYLIGDGICPVFGVPYKLPSPESKEYSPSLDKFIPHLGYVEGNCFVISFKANTIKQNATLSEIRQVVRWMESVEKSQS
jgi:hypothetical protein